MQIFREVCAMTENRTTESRALDALRRIVRALRNVDTEARQSGLRGAQLFVLQQLATVPEQSVSELMARTLTSQSSVSEVVARLVARRLVSRRRSSHDGRRVVLALTPRGKALLRSAPRSAQSRLIAGVQQMPPARRQQLATLLEEWLSAAGMGHVPATMLFEDGASTSERGRATSTQRGGAGRGPR
jgi:DNA-binding MarR family transcriptional regulator